MECRLLEGHLRHNFLVGGGNAVIVKKSSPKNLSANCRSTVGRQLTDSLPTANQQVTDRLRKKENCGKHEQLT